MPMFPVPRPRPDKHTARKAWEASWAADLEAYFKPGLPLHRYPRLISSASRDALAFCAEPQNVLEDDSRVKDICDVDIDMARCLNPHDWQSFQDGWRRLSSNRREEIILEGLYHASCIGSNEQFRGHCPEMTLKDLAKDGGRELLRLLSHWSNLPNLTHATHLGHVYVPNPIFDHIVSLSDAEAEAPGAKATARMCRINRMQFMSMALWNVYRTYQGIEGPSHDTLNTATITPENKKQLKALLDSQYGKGFFKKWRAENITSDRSQLVNACWYCKKGENQLNGERMKGCSKCAALGIKIYYCSRECQVADWKSGVPRPHKVLCGKRDLYLE
ncbi:uncharacterized protein PHACADRAFT_257289 [Phanerochaete carnosa HHB-10118-sp]|uniref:MYND-type domain-containing protein n=1 Tax=Phanerochaete carnosa (strain HHB-10118-sp) TaxID=650164 RepID=K5X0B1_PHACS|nr:uncharacterized protein PHACADRAFT_257289 [Phanerochaete carnosa HHB-10118-sp]EKM56202.1 hypothetical protein PHACADRAFT_257289 [Phanerochaete carnosa HHB-10118-sp]